MPEHHARVTRTSPLAHDVVAIDLALDEPPLRFRAGQFISLACGEDAEGTPIKRSYSIASPSSRQDDFLLIARLIEGGPASAYLAALAPGDRVRFTGPMGFFVLDLAHAGDVVFAATGTGITPVLPMLLELLPRAETGRVRLFWGCREEADLFWLDELRALEHAHPRFEMSVHLSQASPEWTGLRGRITDAVLAAAPSFQKPVFYLVGNGDMIKEVRGKLVAMGVDRKKQIRNEAFFNV